MKFSRLGCMATMFGLGAMSELGAAPVIVHEWGTFTSLQDEKGKAIGGINIDDEPAPSFVYQYGGEVPKIASNTGTFGLPSYRQILEEGYRSGDQQVSLRLETPVLYMYPPAGQPVESVPPLTVHVEFKGGVLSQYYPYAGADFLGNKHPEDIPLANLTSALTWKHVHMGGTGIPLVTDSQLWTTPRAVSAPVVTVKAPSGKTQTEKFLFYRGVAHLNSPLTTTVSRADGSTTISLPSSCATGHTSFTQGWFVEIRPDGSSAFRGVSLDHPDGAGKLDAESPFQNADFSPTHLTELKASMHMALVNNGLFEDEATAMLNTWQLSYFQNPGLRFFFIVPRQWTDTVIPLTIKGAETSVTRVMVGRIELISPSERQTLAKLRTSPCPTVQEVVGEGINALHKQGITGEEAKAYLNGQKPLSKLGVTIPPLLQDFFDMGRFRDALVLHELAVNPSPKLADFVALNGIERVP